MLRPLFALREGKHYMTNWRPKKKHQKKKKKKKERGQKRWPANKNIATIIRDFSRPTSMRACSVFFETDNHSKTKKKKIQKKRKTEQHIHIHTIPPKTRQCTKGRDKTSPKENQRSQDGIDVKRLEKGRRHLFN